jgi:hypothetical protein
MLVPMRTTPAHSVNRSGGSGSASLSVAEEVFDLQTTTEIFQGSESETTTGRVLLHALDDNDSALCGHESDGLTTVGRPWQHGYLPHAPRCRSCALVAGSAEVSGLQLLGPDELATPPPGLPVTGVDIRTAHGSELEQAGADALRAVLAEHDVRRFLLTDAVWVNGQIRGGFSHPLTLSPAALLRGPLDALTTFLHEQMHWVQGPGVDAATSEVAECWPDPPGPPAGSHSAQSSWLHLTVCTLEYLALGELIGPAAAAALLSQQKYYGWMYGKITADPGWFADLLSRHGLAVPDASPVPRRYYGDDWWSAIPGVAAT